MNIAIVGGGLSGLIAAYKLSSKKENKVTLWESTGELGGMLGSYTMPNYAIEKYYHHIFTGDNKTIKLIEELSLESKLKWIGAKNGYYINGSIYPLNTPFDFLKLPHLDFWDITKLFFLIRKIKKIRDWKNFDNISAKKWVINNSNEKIWINFISSLIKSKFGERTENISAAWLIKRIQLRSHHAIKGERLGYLEGGFYQLIKKIKEKIRENDGEIYCNSAIKKIIVRNNAAQGLISVQGKEIKADKIIFTASEDTLKKICPDLKLPQIKYQGSVCVLLSLKEKLIDNIYWLNIKDENIPFGVIVEHTNLIPPANYNSEHLVYLSYYFQNTDDILLKMKNSEIISLYCKKLKTMFARFDKEKLNWWKIKREFPTAPIYEIEYLQKIIPCRVGIKNLYPAGINSKNHYPDRSIEGAVANGLEAADLAFENS